MTRSLEHKVALVTGGARGIGRAISLAFASEGAHVAFSDIQLGRDADEALELIRAQGVKALAVQSDVQDFASTQSVVDDVAKEFQRIDILVNNAGIARDNLLMRMKEEEWDLVIGTNLKGTFNYCRAVAKHMISQREGKIINISSVVGLIGNPGQVNYSASKAGGDRTHENTCKRASFSQHSSQCRRSGFRRDRHDGEAHATATGSAADPDTNEADRATGRNRRRRCLSCLPSSKVHHRPGPVC